VSSLWGLGNATDLSLRLQINYSTASSVAINHAKLLELIDASFHAYKMRVGRKQMTREEIKAKLPEIVKAAEDLQDSLLSAERESLCDSEGYFYSPPVDWFNNQSCKSREPRIRTSLNSGI
jgi:hypothetical protein